MSIKPEPSEVNFIKALRSVAVMCKCDVDEFLIDLYCEAMRPHGWDRAIASLKEIVLTSKRFPTVHDLLEIVAPHVVAQIDAADDAAVAAGRIWEAIGKFGDRKTGPDDDVFQKQREFIGELGWEVVKRQWSRLCAETKTDDMATLKAQWRMEIKGVANRLKAGLPLAPGLPSAETTSALPPAIVGLIGEAAQKMSIESRLKAPEKKIEKIPEDKYGW